jgi:hypothetical protein
VELIDEEALLKKLLARWTPPEGELGNLIQLNIDTRAKMEKEVAEISRELLWQGKVANKLLEDTKN